MTRLLAAALMRPAINNTYHPFALTQRLFTKSAIAYNHYDTLGVPRNATQADISAAYKQLVQLHESDRKPGDDAVYTKLREIRAAYNVLSNYELRKLYNRGGCFDCTHIALCFNNTRWLLKFTYNPTYRFSAGQCADKTSVIASRYTGCGYCEET